MCNYLQGRILSSHTTRASRQLRLGSSFCIDPSSFLVLCLCCLHAFLNLSANNYDYVRPAVENTEHYTSVPSLRKVIIESYKKLIQWKVISEQL